MEQLDELKRRAITSVRRAFGCVSFPGPEHRSLYQAEAADSYEETDQSRDHTGPWEELPTQDINACVTALSFLDEEGLLYYVPGIMLALLERAKDFHGRYYDALGSLLCCLNPFGGGDKDYQWRTHRFRLFNAEQQAAVRDFTHWAAEAHPDDEDAAEAFLAWQAVAKGEPWPSYEYPR